MKKLMRQSKVLFIMITVMVIASLTTTNLVAQSANTASPYYTYTQDSNGRLIKTTEAYTPSIQIRDAGGVKFERPEHIFVDENDYVYITDSLEDTVYVLDENYDYVTKITHDNFSFPISSFVTENEVYVLDKRTKEINVFDKNELLTNNQVVLIKTIGKPSHPIFQEPEEGEDREEYKYQPINLVVDIRGNIYIRATSSPNGLIMLDEDGRFMTFFGGNPVRIPLTERVRSWFLTETQEEKLKKQNETEENSMPYISNVAIDQKGYIYTVTSALKNNPIKKFNVSGTNYFKTDIGIKTMNSIWVGQYNNVYAVSSKGYIFEYDRNGNLLFLFGGKDFTSGRVGLLTTPVSVAANSKDQLLVLDQADSLIQVYEPTPFTNSIHTALDEYQTGNYESSREKWQYILQYNSLFDYAHIGLGDAFMRENNYDDAYREYNYANDSEGMSDAYWGIRQEWMKDNLSVVFMVIVILIVLRVAYGILNKFYGLKERRQNIVSKLRDKSRTFDELLYIFEFLKQPFDGFYSIKRENRVSIKTSTIIYLLLGAVYVLNYRYANLLFVPKIGVNIGYELFILIFIVTLWVISNYLVCAISDGEGSFKNVYNATAYSLTPILLIMPINILISNVITYQEKVFYDFGYLVITIWTGFLMFFMIKDVHNYNVLETLWIIAKSLFTMLILGLFLFIINALSGQMLGIIQEIVTEVINR
ncbi:YIP1 family protein [Haloplasma contractile]|nr:YIP1 family protein [Haloplasma contractile]